MFTPSSKTYSVRSNQKNWFLACPQFYRLGSTVKVSLEKRDKLVSEMQF
jgi:hypothetical protein